MECQLVTLQQLTDNNNMRTLGEHGWALFGPHLNDPTQLIFTRETPAPVAPAPAAEEAPAATEEPAPAPSRRRATR